MPESHARPHRLWPRWAAALVVLHLAAGGVLGQVNQLEFKRTVVEEEMKDGPFEKSDVPLAKPVTEDLTVRLGEACVSVQVGQQKTISDLAARRVITVDLERSEYTDDSVFAELTGRMAEFHNRTMIMESMLAAKLDKAKVPF